MRNAITNNTIDISAGKRYSSFVNFLLLCFPIVINSVKGVGDLIFYTLAALGIYSSISRKISPFNTEGIRLISWTVTGYFSVVVVSVVLSGKMAELAHFISRELHFLFAPFVALAFLRAKLSLNHLLMGMKLGLIVLGIITLFQYLNGVERPSGVMHFDAFGDLTVMMVMFSISNILEENFRQRLLTLSSVSMGIFAVVLSGSRGSWVSLLILIAIYFFLVRKSYLFLSKKIMFSIPVVLTVIIFGVASTPLVQDRVLEAKNDIIQWKSGENRLTSLGLRLEMWLSGIKVARRSPWFGYGYRNTNPVAASYASEEVRETISGFNHLHNEYLTTMVGRGVVGLIALFFILFFPLRFFAKEIENNKLRPQAVMGVMLCAGYASFGLTHVAFGDVFMSAFYLFYLSIFLPAVMRRSIDL